MTLNPIIHDHDRCCVLAFLVARGGKADYDSIKNRLGLSDEGMASNMAALAAAKYVGRAEDLVNGRSFFGFPATNLKTQTIYTLTRLGKMQLLAYCQRLHEVLDELNGEAV